MYNFFRKALRLILKVLTRLAIRKHRPTIVAIIGDGENSIARELIYAVVNINYPAKRNLETPEAEFSVPLTVIGYNRYPHSYLEWMWVVLKTLGQLVKLGKHNHFLVLEVDAVDDEIERYWINTLKPDEVVNTSELETRNQKPKTYGLQLTAYKKLAIQVGQKYSIDPDISEIILDTVELPEGRIRMLSGINESIIVDATHHYFPISIKSVVEVAKELPGRKLIITDNEHDLEYVRMLPDAPHWIVNPKLETRNLKEEDVIVLRGKRTEVIPKYKDLFADRSYLK